MPIIPTSTSPTRPGTPASAPKRASPAEGRSDSAEPRNLARTFEGGALVIGVAVLAFRGLSVKNEATIAVFGVACCLLLPALLAVKLWQPDSFQFGSFMGRGLPGSLGTALFVASLAPLMPAVVYYKPLTWVSPIPAGLLTSAVLAAPLMGIGPRPLRHSFDFLKTVAAPGPLWYQ